MRSPGPATRILVIAAYTVVFYLLLPGLLWWGAALLDRHLFHVEPMHRPWGWLVLGPALVLQTLAVGQMWTRGGGAPVSALPPPRMVATGLYRWVRHPIYFTFNLVVLGVGLTAGSPGLALVVAPLFLPAWILYATVEERFLLRRFGDGYRAYRDEVGLLPRLPRRRAG